LEVVAVVDLTWVAAEEQEAILLDYLIYLSDHTQLL
jgi:hypothetical protein